MALIDWYISFAGHPVVCLRISPEEVHYALFLSKDIGYLSADDKIKRISYLIRKLQDSL